MRSDRHTAGPSVNPAVPSVARIYDYFLGGKNNFEVDREAGDRLITEAAEVPPAARRNRAALARAVRWAVISRGIRQVLDIGSGLPWTEVDDPEMQGLHQQISDLEASPAVQVVYVDKDPVVLAHGRALADGAVIVEADLHDPELLDQPDLQATIDFKEPVVLVLGAILHFVQDDREAAAIVQRLAARLAPGSIVVISHATADELTPDRVKAAYSVYEDSADTLVFRTHEGIQALFGELPLEESGVTRLDEWHPELAPPGAGKHVRANQCAQVAEANHKGSSWLQIGAAFVPAPAEPEAADEIGGSTAPSVARVAAAYQGGRPELTADERALIADVHAVAPEAALLARQTHAFTQRAVRDVAGLGVRQFIDLGCGIPPDDEGHVHQIACRALREAGSDMDVRVVYVDNDPDVITHRRDALGDIPGIAVVAADIRHVDTILKDPDVQRLIDFGEPIGLIASLVLHCIRAKDQPGAIITGFQRVMAPRSYLILSHITEGGYPEPARAGANVYVRHRATTPMILRSPAEIRCYFDDFRLLPPGLVKPNEWRPDTPASFEETIAPDWVLAGVGKLASTQHQSALDI